MMYDPNNPIIRALLETIASPESGNRANVMFGGKTFDSLAQHPNVANPITSGPNAGKTSSAAGKYQFLNSTWQDQAKKLGLTDFSVKSQDAGAANLAGTTYKAKTGGDLATDLADPAKRAGVFAALNGTWTSLPGGIEQGVSAQRANTMFEKNLHTFSQDFGPDNPGFASFLPGGGGYSGNGGENAPGEGARGAPAPAASGGGIDPRALMALRSREGDGIGALLAQAARPRQPQQQVALQVQDMAPAQDYGQMMMQLLPQQGAVPNATMQAAPYNPASMPLSDLLLRL